MNNRLGTTKSLGQKHTLDKFYTKPEIALSCIEKIVNIDQFDLIVEPSAGNGSFSNQLPSKTLALDLEPENELITKKDWFSFNNERNTNKILVIGNPPFGQQGSLAVKFINHAAKFANTIAFILPASFNKKSVQNRIHPNLHLQATYDIPRNGFLLENESLDVPCVFQVWEYKNEKRRPFPVYYPKGWDFTKNKEAATMWIQRVGGKAGSYGYNCLERNIQSNYFMVFDSVEIQKLFTTTLNQLEFPCSNKTLGPKSISKQELLEEIYQNNKTLARKVN